MIKDNQKYLNRAHVVADGLIIAGSYIASYFIKFELLWGDRSPYEHLPMEVYFRALYYLVPMYLLLYYLSSLYTPRRALRIGDEFSNIIKANIGGVLCNFAIHQILHQQDFSRSMVAIFFVLNIVLTCTARLILRKFLRYIRSRGYNIKHIMLVGYSRAAEAYISRIKENPSWGYDVSGILDDDLPLGTSYKGVAVVGRIEQLGYYLDHANYDEITITLPLTDYERLEELVGMCEKSGVHTKFIPDYTSLFPSNPYTEDIQGLPVINIRYVPLSNTLNKTVKRVVDIIGSLCAIILFSPVMLFAAIGTKCTSKGPIIYKQERIGLNGKPFMMYKFRTMRVQSVAEEQKGWTTKDDDRVTKFGKFLRKTSIDEMPQFFNILIGKMSIVGPRPERPQFVDRFKEQIPRYMVKHQVRPGLTGWAQINGYRGDTSIRKRIDYDIYYIENWTLSFDLKIMLGTIRYGFVNKNAY